MEAIREFNKKRGSKEIFAPVPDDFADPLPEDFLLRPIPE
jgi:hypothetical protein